MTSQLHRDRYEPDPAQTNYYYPKVDETEKDLIKNTCESKQEYVAKYVAAKI